MYILLLFCNVFNIFDEVDMLFFKCVLFFKIVVCAVLAVVFVIFVFEIFEVEFVLLFVSFM